ncbi:MAG TPA: RidA family protein [Xanthobacteraceae bacterium]|jgi:enamine deaminase RidA (YjgF/YER057c/UK114 family)|nr:RidA family protein [Xanthobacteraceae bacterium]
MPNTRFLNPPAIHPPRGYSHVVEATGPGRIVYIAGQLGVDPSGKMGVDFRAQAVQAFENLKAALAVVGGTFEQVVKVNMYFTDIDAQLPIAREVRDRYVNTAAAPASTAVQISKLAREGALYEIEAVALLP